MNYQYDSAGNQTRVQNVVTLQFGTLTESYDYAYDQANRLVSISAGPPATAYAVLSFGYTGDDQLSRINRGLSIPDEPAPVGDYAYERATGRLTSISHTRGIGNTATAKWNDYVDEFFYQYDRDDRVTQWRTLKDGTATYTYDKIDQLANAGGGKGVRNRFLGAEKVSGADS